MLKYTAAKEGVRFKKVMRVSLYIELSYILLSWGAVQRIGFGLSILPSCQAKFAGRFLSIALLPVEFGGAQGTAPGTFRRRDEWRREAVHVVTAVAVVAEQQLIVVVRGSAHGAVLTLDALPAVLAHRDDHVGGELQTRRMPGAAAVRARDELFGFKSFLVFAGVAQTEVTIRRRDGTSLFRRRSSGGGRSVWSGTGWSMHVSGRRSRFGRVWSLFGFFEWLAVFWNEDRHRRLLRRNGQWRR